MVKPLPRSLFLLGAVSLLSCDEAPLQTLAWVYIEADQESLADVAELRVTVCDQEGEAVFDDTQNLAELDLGDPLLHLSPLDGEASRTFAVVARLLDDQGAQLAMARLIGAYEKDDETNFNLQFDGACRQVLCFDGTETCRDGICQRAWSGTRPDGSFGSCSRDVSFRTVDDEVLLAAEEYSNDEAPEGWVLQTESDHEYMQSLDGEAMHDFSAHDAPLHYDIHFATAGTYNVHLRTRALSTGDNGFFAALDGDEVDYGTEAHYVYVKREARWYWYTDGGGMVGGESVRLRMVTFSVDVGEHLFSIHRRNPLAQLDQIWLSRHQVAPLDTGSPEDLPADLSVFRVPE